MAVTMVIAALSFVVHYWKYRCGRRGNLLYRNGTNDPCVGTVFLKFIKRNTTEIKRLTHERL